MIIAHESKFAFIIYVQRHFFIMYSLHGLLRLFVIYLQLQCAINLGASSFFHKCRLLTEDLNRKNIPIAKLDLFFSELSWIFISYHTYHNEDMAQIFCSKSDIYVRMRQNTEERKVLSFSTWHALPTSIQFPSSSASFFPFFWLS